jgi:hypothetical protein
MTPSVDGCRGAAFPRVPQSTLAGFHPYTSSAVGMPLHEEVPLSLVTTTNIDTSSRRVIYEARVVITGGEDDARMAAVKFRAFLRRYQKPAGLTIRLADEQQRDERT